MADVKSLTPAYVPWKTFLSVLDSFSTFLPDTIDSTMWPSYSGGIKSQLLGALKFLGLIDDNNVPTDALRTLAKTDAQHRPLQFRSVMKAAYGSLMALDLTKATPGSFDAEMRKYGQEGDTHRKAASFFLQAAKWTALPLSPLLMKKGSLAGSKRRKIAASAKPKTTMVANGKSNSDDFIQQPGSQKKIALSDGSWAILKTEKDLFGMAAEDRKFVMGLLETIEEYEAAHPVNLDESEDEADEEDTD